MYAKRTASGSKVFNSHGACVVCNDVNAEIGPRLAECPCHDGKDVEENGSFTAEPYTSSVRSDGRQVLAGGACNNQSERISRDLLA